MWLSLVTAPVAGILRCTSSSSMPDAQTHSRSCNDGKRPESMNWCHFFSEADTLTLIRSRIKTITAPSASLFTLLELASQRGCCARRRTHRMLAYVSFLLLSVSCSFSTRFSSRWWERMWWWSSKMISGTTNFDVYHATWNWILAVFKQSLSLGRMVAAEAQKHVSS